MSLHTMKPVYDPDGHRVTSDLPQVKFSLLHENAKLPTKATGGAACYDIYSDHDIYFNSSLTSRIVHTGVAIELPRQHVGLVCSRSGLAAQQGIFVLNAPGIIDEGRLAASLLPFLLVRGLPNY
jgi:dUTPase